MAYFSYRSISSITNDAIEQYEESLEDEGEAVDGDSQLESESAIEDDQQIPLSENNVDEVGEEVKLSEEVQMGNLPQN
jgi:predicted RNase H-like HicB family nuclease